MNCDRHSIYEWLGKPSDRVVKGEIEKHPFSICRMDVFVQLENGAFNSSSPKDRLLKALTVLEMYRIWRCWILSIILPIASWLL